MIKTAHINILENSTVTLSAGTENPSYPIYRLYDRDPGRIFQPTAAETIEVKLDQGPSGILGVDSLFIPPGHNLAGMTLDIMFSPNDVDYYAAVTQWTGEAGLIYKYWGPNPYIKRYWKFIITSPASKPEIAELFLTSDYDWERDPSRPAGPFDKVFNVNNAVTSGGQDRFLVYGDPKRQRTYHMPRCGESQKDNILTLNDAWAGSKPFWLLDHEGNWIYGKLMEPIALKEVAYQMYSFDFKFLEVLP
jgi:hypothetical protein